MKNLLLTAAALIGFAALPLAAQDRPVVVELYTSQGCSSCPAADAILADLAGRDDVIAIALHVDYWDYIGWKDTFGSPAHSDRQRAYAAAGKRRMIYTPEMIVQGETDIVGAKEAAQHLESVIAKHAAAPTPVRMDVSREGDQVTISARSERAMPLTVHMLRLIPRATQVIERGENKGKTIEYTSIAQDWTVLGKWDGQGELALSAQAKGEAPVVVLIQQAQAGPVMAAARLD